MNKAVFIVPPFHQPWPGTGEGYSSQDMDLEIQRVARELYKAFSGLNEEFERPQDQVGPIQLLEYQILWDGMGGTPVFFSSRQRI